MYWKGLSCALIASFLATVDGYRGCGEVDVIFTGLPPFHPLVTAQGFNGTLVNAGLRADAANMIKAGYNSRVVLFGPEQPIDVLRSRMADHNWDVTGIGYGVRGSHLSNLTTRFQELVGLYRKEAPFAPIVFDYSFTTALWAVEQAMPLSRNCSNHPGKDLGFDIICDADVCGSN